MRKKWIRVYRSPRWDVVYNTKTLVWRVKRRTASKWVAAIEFIANGLSWKRNVQVPEALWWEVMTQARRDCWQRTEVEEGEEEREQQTTRETRGIDWALLDDPMPVEPAPATQRAATRPRNIFARAPGPNSLLEATPTWDDLIAQADPPREVSVMATPPETEMDIARRRYREQMERAVHAGSGESYRTALERALRSMNNNPPQQEETL